MNDRAPIAYRRGSKRSTLNSSDLRPVRRVDRVALVFATALIGSRSQPQTFTRTRRDKPVV
jgi:hypothetical protein